MTVSNAMESQGFEIVDDVYVAGPGRPMTGRTAELYTLISQMSKSPSSTAEVALMDDEKGSGFYRFTQRCRSAAKKVGVKVRVAKSRTSDDVGLVMVLEG